MTTDNQVRNLYFKLIRNPNKIFISKYNGTKYSFICKECENKISIYCDKKILCGIDLDKKEFFVCKDEVNNSFKYYIVECFNGYAYDKYGIDYDLDKNAYF